MDADESRHEVKKSAKQPKFDAVACAFVLLSIATMIWGGTKWDSDVLPGSLFRIVTGPIAAYLLLSGLFGLTNRRIAGFFKYVLMKGTS
jgi:hypothetical protein